jgi:hypothetical protein
VKRWERGTFNTLVLMVAASGFAYLWMKYALDTDDPFAVVNHPWQTMVFDLHLLASPALVLMFGIVFNSHVMKKFRASGLPNRRSGYVSLGTFSAMVVSGYLLQVSANEAWLKTLVVLHVGSGTIFAVAYGAHLVISYTLARRQQPAAAMRGVA